MKKILALLLALCMVFALAACGQSAAPAAEEAAPAEAAPAETASGAKVAMITDYGDITDQSFNQTTYEACKALCEGKGVDFTYFKPASDSDEDRVSMIEKAIDEGYNVIVMPGYAFAPAIAATAPNYADVTFIALDVSEYDLTSAGLTELPANLYSAVYQEELCGYMARKSCAATWPVSPLSSWATPSWASWAAWLFPPLSATATASCRALTPPPLRSAPT